MAKPKQYRWECPLCNAGKLASSRPRMDDVKRYCLSCSEETGRLVSRICPALERRREQRAQAGARRAASKRATASRHKRAEKDAQRRVETLHGVDIRAEFKRLERIFPQLGFVYLHIGGGHYASQGGELRIDLYPEGVNGIGDSGSALSVVHLLAHEVAHSLAPPVRGDNGSRVCHGPNWKRAFAEILLRAYNTEISWGAVPDGYAIDRRVSSALRERWEGKSRTPWRKSR